MSLDRACRSTGSSIIEAVVVLAVFGIVLQAVAPAFVRWRQARRLEAAAEELVLFAAGLRVAAAAAGTSRGLAIDSTAETVGWTPVADGDGDGLRRADLRAGRDVAIGRRRDLATNYPGVIAGLPPGVRTPNGGVPPTDGVAFGRGDLLSLSPDGTATSGSLYLSNQFGDAVAVRVYGVTARFSIWRRRHTDGVWRRRW